MQAEPEGGSSSINFNEKIINVFEATEAKLIKTAIAGKSKAWFELVNRYESSLYNYSVRMTGNREDGLDLMQEIFISVYKNLPTYRAEGSFKAWIFRIAHFRCVEFYRRKKRMNSLDDEPECVDENQAPLDRLIETETNKKLVFAMQRLPFNQKSVVELKFFGQFTFDEIGSQLSISSNTAKSRLYTALATLRDILEVEHV